MKNLNKNVLWAWGSVTEGAKKGGEGEPTWLVTTGEAEIPGGLAIGWYHEAPLRLRAGVEAEPDDGRWLDVAFGALRLSVIICDKAMLRVTSGGRNRYYS